MVKVIIMTDGKVIEKEGEFFFGFTAKKGRQRWRFN